MTESPTPTLVSQKRLCSWCAIVLALVAILLLGAWGSVEALQGFPWPLVFIGAALGCLGLSGFLMYLLIGWSGIREVVFETDPSPARVGAPMSWRITVRTSHPIAFTRITAMLEIQATRNYWARNNNRAVDVLFERKITLLYADPASTPPETWTFAGKIDLPTDLPAPLAETDAASLERVGDPQLERLVRPIIGSLEGQVEVKWTLHLRAARPRWPDCWIDLDVPSVPQSAPKGTPQRRKSPPPTPTYSPAAWGCLGAFGLFAASILGAFVLSGLYTRSGTELASFPLPSEKGRHVLGTFEVRQSAQPLKVVIADLRENDIWENRGQITITRGAPNGNVVWTAPFRQSARKSGRRSSTYTRALDSFSVREPGTYAVAIEWQDADSSLSGATLRVLQGGALTSRTPVYVCVIVGTASLFAGVILLFLAVLRKRPSGQ